MKLKLVLTVLLIGGGVLASALFAPHTQPARASSEEDLFDPVYAIMAQQRDQSGCRVCHINKRTRVRFTWFGNDKASVLRTLETGITPDGQDLGYIPVEGGRQSVLAEMLHTGSMPYGSPRWNAEQLALLDAWLRTYEPDPFEPVWQIMNQPGANGGCQGCHIRSTPGGAAPWFGPDKATVLNTFETGVTPDGRRLSAIPVQGGRAGRLATLLRTGSMPRFGRRWIQEELDLLNAWLILYE